MTQHVHIININVMMLMLRHAYMSIRPLLEYLSCEGTLRHIFLKQHLQYEPVVLKVAVGKSHV